MKKSIIRHFLLAGLLVSTTSFTGAQYVLAQETTSVESHEKEDDHDHEFELETELVVKREDDQYIVLHGDHYHKVPVSEFSAEEQSEIAQHLTAHPELAQEYDKKIEIYNGYFEDSEVKDRSLEDYEGDWQSVFPYLQDGTLEPVMQMKAAKEGATMTAEEYTEYYTVGYQTDVKNIVIDDNKMSFTNEEGTVTGEYEYVGYEILQYKKGNRGVRYLFTKVAGDEGAPLSVQFSDHNIAPTDDVSHFHIFFSNDSHEVLLEEMDNWPTYYPTDWSGSEILADQLNH